MTMVTIGRHDSKLSGYAPALPTPLDAPTIVAPHGPDNPHPQRRQANGGGSDCGADVAGLTKLPPRPGPEILSEEIPLFFIGRNADGFWVAREADGRIGGIFLRKQSALRFANRSSQPGGCATMFLSERFELDVENKGNPLVARLAAARRIMLQLAQRTAPQAAAMAKRAHPAALLLGLFATAFTATIVLRLAIWLAVLAAKSAF
jgi:hypothetical protein